MYSDYLMTKPTVRSAVQDVSLRRGLLIPLSVSEVQRRS